MPRGILPVTFIRMPIFVMTTCPSDAARNEMTRIDAFRPAVADHLGNDRRPDDGVTASSPNRAQYLEVPQIANRWFWNHFPCSPHEQSSAARPRHSVGPHCACPSELSQVRDPHP